MENFKEVRKQVGKPLDPEKVFERIELLRRNAAFLPKIKEQEDDRIVVRKVVGGSR